MKIALRKIKLIDGSTMRMNELKSKTLSLIKLNYPNVVKTIGLCVEERGIVQEYCGKLIDEGDFGTEINSLKTLSEMMGSNSNLEIKLKILHDVVEGPKYLHENNTLAQDLKAANVSVTSDSTNEWMLKIADFGKANSKRKVASRAISSQLLSRQKLTYTTAFLAPELIPDNLSQQPDPTVNSDIYAFRMLMYEVIFSDRNP